MKKMVGITFFVIMLTMGALVGGMYLGANSLIDPALTGLSRTVASLQPDAQVRLSAHVTELRDLREAGRLHIPAAMLLTGLVMVLILSPFLRKFARSREVLQAKPQERRAAATGSKQASPEVDSRSLAQAGACRMMALLQSRGRFIDFLQEDIAGYPDAQIGAAVRNIHEDCRNALDEYVTLAPLLMEKEGETVEISKGYDPSEIRLTGHVTGKAPFRGTLQHPGWKVTEIRIPDLSQGQKSTIIAPAEVEIE
jgi:hypothetical protein